MELESNASVMGFLSPFGKGEGVRNNIVFVSPVKTGVQSICNRLKKLDSGSSPE